MQSGGDVRAVFDRLARGIKAVGDSVRSESGREFMLDAKYGYIHSCPTNLGTGMRASVHVDLPGWTKEGLKPLQERCEELHLQPRGTRGESGGQTGEYSTSVQVYRCTEVSLLYVQYKCTELVILISDSRGEQMYRTVILMYVYVQNRISWDIV